MGDWTNDGQRCDAFGTGTTRGCGEPCRGTTPPQKRPGELTRFSLDFPGGTPAALVAAIQRATEKPLNAIVPDDYAEMHIPALKMSNVNVQTLFSALEQASRKTQAYETGSYYGGGRSAVIAAFSR